MTRKVWTYRGVHVFPADQNASGIRWSALSSAGNLRADTKQSMRQLIVESKAMRHGGKGGH